MDFIVFSNNELSNQVKMWKEITDSLVQKATKDSLIIELQQKDIISLNKQNDYKEQKVQNVKTINRELLDQIEKNDKKIRTQKLKSKLLTGITSVAIIILTTIILIK